MSANTTNTLACALMLALPFNLIACDDMPLTQEELLELDLDGGVLEPITAEKCEMHFGAVNPDRNAWVSPWIALSWSGDCVYEDFANLVIKINGDFTPHKVLQLTSEQDPRCAILMMRGYAKEAHWTVSWLGEFGFGYVDSSDIGDGWGMGDNAYLHEKVWTSAPADYEPECQVPLDWHLDPKPWQ